MQVEMCFGASCVLSHILHIAVAGWMSWNNIGPMATPKQPK